MVQRGGVPAAGDGVERESHGHAPMATGREDLCVEHGVAIGSSFDPSMPMSREDPGVLVDAAVGSSNLRFNGKRIEYCIWEIFTDRDYDGKKMIHGFSMNVFVNELARPIEIHAVQVYTNAAPTYMLFRTQVGKSTHYTMFWFK